MSRFTSFLLYSFPIASCYSYVGMLLVWFLVLKFVVQRPRRCLRWLKRFRSLIEGLLWCHFHATSFFSTLYSALIG